MRIVAIALLTLVVSSLLVNSVYTALKEDVRPVLCLRKSEWTCAQWVEVFNPNYDYNATQGVMTSAPYMTRECVAYSRNNQ